MKQIKSLHKIMISIIILLMGLVIPTQGEKSPSRVVNTVPYVEQMRNYCGPAALTSVLKYWNVATDQKTVGKVVYDSNIRATNGADMMLYARDKGLSGYSWNSNISDLKEKLAQGVPVIVLQDISTSDKSGHYRVATGYDDSRRVIFVNDPYSPSTKELSYAKFQSLWQRHGNWSLLICPPEKDIFKKELDENNPVVHIDLAYIYLKRGDVTSSQRESRLALALEPQNYSAQTLLAQATRAAGFRDKGEKVRVY
jgi:predicted double-glycine peptidase